jgi:hypothetical protein
MLRDVVAGTLVLMFSGAVVAAVHWWKRGHGKSWVDGDSGASDLFGASSDSGGGSGDSGGGDGGGGSGD